MVLPEVPPGIRTMGFPGQYLQGAGALQYLGQLLVRMGYQRSAVLCDAIIADKVLPTVAVSLQSHGIEATQLAFPGECTRAVIDLLTCHARDGNPDVIVGLGGGKAVDTAKGISLTLNVPVVICPTIASNDAPNRRLIALYDDAHRLAGVDFLKANRAAVVVDTQIIAQAPARFFAAGIGDAISKKFEAAQCNATGRVNAFGTLPLETGLAGYACAARGACGAAQGERCMHCQHNAERAEKQSDQFAAQRSRARSHAAARRCHRRIGHVVTATTQRIEAKSL